MDFGGPTFVIAIIALSTAGWLINNWIRAKHGYALEDEWTGKTYRTDSGEADRLKAENKALRDSRRMNDASGMPLGFDKKERA